MLSLMKGNFYRLFKENKFYIFLIITFVTSLLTILLQYFLIDIEVIKNTRVIYSLLCGAVSLSQNFGIIYCVCLSMYIGVEFSQNTIRNKVMLGRKRFIVYLSTLIPSTVYILTLYIISIIPYLTIGISLFGVGVNDVFMDYFKVIVISISILTGLSATVTFTSMISKSFVVAILVNIILPSFIVLMIFGFNSATDNQFLNDLGKFLTKSTIFGQSGSVSTLTDQIAWILISNTIYISLITILGCYIFSKLDLK